MATTIRSTGLDFNSIRNNLKTFLQEKEEFSDYNFEAAALSNLLDVLAYNTHYNGLIANFALNESYLSTAQIRSSLVGLSESIGYIPGSKTSSYAQVVLSIQNSSPTAPLKYSIPAGHKFSTTVDGESYTFQTRENITAQNNAGNYVFEVEGSQNIKIYEGISKTRSFYVAKPSKEDVYIISDENLDLDSVTVTVYNSSSSTSGLTYTNINKVTSIDEESRIYVLKEAPNGYYELSFGNGTTLGNTPVSGNKIEVKYLSVSGSAPNGATDFEADDWYPSIEQGGGGPFIVNVVLSSNGQARGGAEKETIESIRKNAPFQYAAQNRMVTAADYSSLVLRNFSAYIQEEGGIKSWGGEDNIPANYGKVYLSIIFTADEGLVPSIKKDIKQFAKDLSVASFTVEFADPIETYVEISCAFQFNPQLTTANVSNVEGQVRQAIQSYFDDNLGKFDRSFRRSNLLTYIDNVSTAVLSSKADVKMQQRFIAQKITYDQNNIASVQSRLGVETDYLLTFPTQIRDPLLDEYVVSSSPFVYENSTCRIRNRLGSKIIELYDISNNVVLIDNLGSYNSENASISLIGFAPQNYLSGRSDIRISVMPANQSAITPLRNNILLYDPDASGVTAIITSST